jgi:hypothetical protein
MAGKLVPAAIVGPLQERFVREQVGPVKADPGFAGEAFEFLAGDRTFKLGSGTTSEPGRYVKSLRGARDGRREACICG